MAIHRYPPSPLQPWRDPPRASCAGSLSQGERDVAAHKEFHYAPRVLVAEIFRQHFERFGKVVEAQIMVDHTSGRSRGFG